MLYDISLKIAYSYANPADAGRHLLQHFPFFVGKNVAHSQGLAEYITGAIEGRGLGYRQAIRREITLTTADGTRIANIYCAGMSEIEGKPPFGIKVYDHYCWE